jgi:hypothetical protein
MRIEKLIDDSDRVVPLMASLPYSVATDMDATTAVLEYDAPSQQTIFAGKRDFSTCREDDSAGGIFSTKSDTKKDD